MGLDEAWDAALDAQPADQAPWRVLADLLLSQGELRGEWMQLELDAELAPLKGLARGRAAELRASLAPALLPPGASLDGAEFKRAALRSCACEVARAQAPEDSRWRTVERLLFLSDGAEPEAWGRTPLSGAALRRGHTLSGLEGEGLEALAHAPPKPRLERVSLRTAQQRPAAWWAAQWGRLLPAHPRLKELRFGPYGVGAQHAVEQWLAPLAGRPLGRVSVALEPGDLAAVAAWRRSAACAFEVQARLSAGFNSSVLVGDEGLVLHSSGDFSEALERLVRTNWPADVAAPAIHHAAHR